MFKNYKILNFNKSLIINVTFANDFLFFTPTQQLSIYCKHILDVSYTGKTYKWSVRPKFWKLIFNRVHPNILFFPSNLSMKKMAKTKFRLFLNSMVEKNLLVDILYKTRRYNIFTHRGLKIKGRLFLKKRGKVSTYR